MAQVRKQVNVASGPLIDETQQQTILQALIDGMVPVRAFCEHVQFVADQMQETSVSVRLLAEVMRDFSKDED